MPDRTARSHTRTARARKPLVSKVTNARDALADFGQGMETFCLTFGQFSLFDAVEALLERTGPADVCISTWTAGSADLTRASEQLRRGAFRSLRMVVDRSFATRQPGYLATVRELFGDDAIRATRTHAKFVTIVNAVWAVSVRTSMNMNSNPRLESIEVTDEPSLTDFLVSVVDELFEEVPAGKWDKIPVPDLPGIEGVAPTPVVSMGRMVATERA